MTSLAMMVVGVRLYGQARITKLFGLSDWLMLASILTIIGFASLISVQYHYGWGRHQACITDLARLETQIKYNFAGQPFGIMGSTFGRLSFIVFMTSLFGSRNWVRHTLWVIFGAQIVTNVVTVAMIYAQCKDPRALYIFTLPQDQCWPAYVQTVSCPPYCSTCWHLGWLIMSPNETVPRLGTHILQRRLRSLPLRSARCHGLEPPHAYQTQGGRRHSPWHVSTVRFNLLSLSFLRLSRLSLSVRGGVYLRVYFLGSTGTAMASNLSMIAPTISCLVLASANCAGYSVKTEGNQNAEPQEQGKSLENSFPSSTLSHPHPHPHPIPLYCPCTQKKKDHECADLHPKNSGLVGLVMKCVYLNALSYEGDYSYNTVPMFTWIMVEGCLVAIAASAPVLRPMFRHTFPSRVGTTDPNSYDLPRYAARSGQTDSSGFTRLGSKARTSVRVGTTNSSRLSGVPRYPGMTALDPGSSEEDIILCLQHHEQQQQQQQQQRQQETQQQNLQRRQSDLSVPTGGIVVKQEYTVTSEVMEKGWEDRESTEIGLTIQTKELGRVASLTESSPGSEAKDMPQSPASVYRRANP